MKDKPTYQTRPFGAARNVEDAALAETATSAKLVGEEENDAFFFRSLETEGIKLNQAQLEAVRHGEGPGLVLAGAGSGKTRVLTVRTAYLLTVKKVNPKAIMLVTFSKKAADEMQERIRQLPGLAQTMVRAITTGTFHSIFWRLLKSKGCKRQVLRSEKRKQVAIKLILKEKKLQNTYEPETLLALLSSYKNNLLNVSDLPAHTTAEKETKEVLRLYEQWKESWQLIDFDDMLLESYYLLLEDKPLLQSMQQRFQHVLVDEWYTEYKSLD